MDAERPATLADALALAIADARNLDHEKYWPNAGIWHTPSPREIGGVAGLCQVCLAGAVVAGTLGFPKDSPASVSPQTFISSQVLLPWKNVLFAIDNARLGSWHAAWGHFYDMHAPADLYSLPVPEFREFCGWDQMNDHIDSLERILPQLRAIEEATLAEAKA